MAAGKRKENESFEEYRNRLKTEAKLLKEYLKGRITWNQGEYRKNPNDKKTQRQVEHAGVSQGVRKYKVGKERG